MLDFLPDLSYTNVMNTKSSINKEGAEIISTERQHSANGAKQLYDKVMNNPEMKLLTPEDMIKDFPTKEEQEEMNKRSCWSKGTKTDIQILNALSKKLAHDQYDGWNNYSCPMKSRHKTQLMIGLSYLIPKFIEHNKLSTYLTVRQILLHLATASLEDHKKGNDVAWNAVEHITNELVAKGRDELDPWKEDDAMA